jgi:cobalt ECF transporter T component CbiQ
VSATTAPSTPDWLLEGQLGLCPCGCIGKRRKGNFVEKTISGAASVARRAMFADDVAAQGGLLQRIEPRVKLVSLLLLLVAAALVRYLPVLVALYLLTLLMAVASRLSLPFFVKRVWLFVPVFTGIVVLPATLSIITPGHIVIPLGHWWFGQEIGITRQGLMGAGLIVTRVAVSISLVVLLTLTTPWNRLLAALRALMVPRMFVLVLAMCYRYVFHLLNSVTDMYTARKARTVGRQGGTGSGRMFVAASAGALFAKASALSDEVHLAMISRGYTGDVRTLGQRRVHAADLVWGLLAAAVALATVGADRALGR